MFNGIIYNTGKVKYLERRKKSIYVGVITSLAFKKKDIGSSICCDGVCLTITEIIKNEIFFYISKETLKRSKFKYIKINQLINLEKSLFYGQNISGHFLQGHVDDTAKIIKITFVDKTWVIRFKFSSNALNKFLVEKASISIDGVSLTISKVYKNFFEINVIPHTLKLTNLKNLKQNNLVNVEIDILSKYIYKYSN
tara:strand:- start:72 stop:659 length:588 start_codon:yes stop_codon:yes gene_type:complete